MATIRRRFACGIMLLACPIFACFADRSSADDPRPAKAVPIDPRLVVLQKSLRDAATAAEGIADPGIRANTLAEVANSQVQAADRESARATALKASVAAKGVVADDSRWSFLLYTASALYYAGDREAARADIEKALHEAIAFTPLESLFWALSNVAETSAYVNDLQAARKTLEVMEKRARAMQPGQPRIQALRTVASARASSGDFAGALKFALDENGEDREARAEILSRMLMSFGVQLLRIQNNGAKFSKEQREERRNFLLAIAKAVDTPEFSDHQIDGVLVMCLATLGESDDASNIVRRMGEGPYGPLDKIGATVVPRSLLTIGAAEFKAGRIEEARVTIRQALDWLVRHPELPLNTRDNLRLSLASAQAAMGDAAEAIKTQEGVSKTHEGLDKRISCVALYVNVASSLRRKGDQDGAREFFRRALREAEDGARDPKLSRMQNIFLARISTIRTNLGEHEAALEALEKITSPTSKGSAAMQMAKIRAETGDVPGATAWASSLADPSLRARALNGVVEGGIEKPK
jgi:tetratricopeptide (TPR) repeat protein